MPELHKPNLPLPKVLHRPFWLMAGATVLANLLMLVMPIYLTQIYDRVLVSRSLDTLFYLSLIALFALAVFGALEAVRGLIAQRAAARFEVELAEPLVAHAVGQATPVATLRDLGRVRSFLSSRVIQQVFDLPFAPLFLILLFILHPLLGCIGLIGVGILLGITLLNHRVTQADQQAAEQASSRAQQEAQAMAVRSDDVRAMGLLKPMLARWGERELQSLQLSDSVARRNSGFYGLIRFSRQMLQICILGIGAFLVLSNDLSAGVIFASSIISSRAFLPIEQIVGSWRNIVQARTAFNAVLQAHEEAGKAQRTVKLPTPSGLLTAENLSYHVEVLGREPHKIVTNVSLEIEPGTILGIVGPSGAGKSTLARLMAGLIAPTHGSIRLDGFALEQWDPHQRGQAFGYVGQDITYFPGSTIAETISRFDRNFDDKAIIAAAKFAGAHDLIARLPDGYQTRISGGGVRLSGGQTQVIALARAMYGDPKLLVLDEPNAHLDPQGEQRLAQALSTARDRGVGIVIVTQRSSILQVTDQILSMRDGEAVSMGPSEQMLRPKAHTTTHTSTTQRVSVTRSTAS